MTDWRFYKLPHFICMCTECKNINWNTWYIKYDEACLVENFKYFGTIDHATRVAVGAAILKIRHYDRNLCVVFLAVARLKSFFAGVLTSSESPNHNTCGFHFAHGPHKQINRAIVRS